MSKRINLEERQAEIKERLTKERNIRNTVGETLSIVNGLRKRKSFLLTSEMIKLVKVRRNTLCKWVREGKIAAKLIGTRYQFDPYEVADWLEAREV